MSRLENMLYVKAMEEKSTAAPASGSPEISVSAERARDDWAPSPATRHGVQGVRVVFIDFGRGKIYALTDDGADVSVFDSLVDTVKRLSPTIIVVDSLFNKLQNTVAELAKKGIVFLRLVNPKKVSEERESNGVGKSDENDVRLLRTLYRRQPELFQPLFIAPEELEVRALTEMWVELAGMKKASKRARTTTDNPVVVKVNKMLQNSVNELSKEIHEKALNLTLYRMAVEELGLKGPALAYIVSHDSMVLKLLPRDRLIFRYQMTGRRKHRRRNIKSRLLITLAMSAVLNKHSRYHEVYRKYFERFEVEGNNRKKAYWKAVLRVAERILKDLHSLAKRTPDT